MFDSFFHRDRIHQDEAFFYSIRKLETQKERLRIAATKLRKRDEALREVCKSAILKGSKERAVIYANEIVEIKKLFSLVSNAQLTMERVILRLQTIRDLGPIVEDIRSVLGVTKKVSKQLIRVMPDVSIEMSRLGTVINEMLNVTELSSVSSIKSPVVNNAATEEILRETSEIAEEVVRESLPEPPIGVLTEKTETVGAIKQMVAIATGGSVALTQGELPTERHVPLESTKASSTTHVSSVEDWVLEYAQKNKGEVNVRKCAEELNVLSKDVLNALEILSAEGKIKIAQ